MRFALQALPAVTSEMEKLQVFSISDVTLAKDCKANLVVLIRPNYTDNNQYIHYYVVIPQLAWKIVQYS